MSIGKNIALSSISIYRRYVSPRKGFSCPHKLIHGGVSCSTYIHQQIDINGLFQIKQVIKQRGLECKEAAILLANKKPDNLNRKKNKKGFGNFDECYCEAPLDIISCLTD